MIIYHKDWALSTGLDKWFTIGTNLFPLSYCYFEPGSWRHQLYYICG